MGLVQGDLYHLKYRTFRKLRRTSLPLQRSALQRVSNAQERQMSGRDAHLHWRHHLEVFYNVLAGIKC